MVQVLALEGVGDDGLVLHAGDVGVAGVLEREDRALQLPGRRVRARERVVPGDVVLQDGRRAGASALGISGEGAQALDVVEDGLRGDPEGGDLGFHGSPFGRNRAVTQTLPA